MTIYQEETNLTLKAQISLAESIGKKQIRSYEEEDSNDDIKKEVFNATYKDFYKIAKKGLLKGERSELFSEIKDKYISFHPLIL